METGIAIALAWPQTQCKQAGAWYDGLMRFAGINEGGYYTVGHAAVILISFKHEICEYFDFGRYHAPYQHGRVRDQHTDHDLAIHTTPEFSEDRQQILNLSAILRELYRNPSCHGHGPVFASAVQINFKNAYEYTKKLQGKGFIKYGPFVTPGTNCSRFVSNVIQAGAASIALKVRLKLPLTVTPTPLGNLRALGSGIFVFGYEDRHENIVSKQIAAPLS